MSTAVQELWGEDTEKQCQEYLGTVVYAHMFRLVDTQSQRLGQAFFNVLDPEDQDKLRALDVDPFYSTTWAAIQKALDYLLEH